MKKEYQSPEIDVEILVSSDVVLSSNLTGGGNSGYEKPFDSLPGRDDIFII